MVIEMTKPQKETEPVDKQKPTEQKIVKKDQFSEYTESEGQVSVQDIPGY